MEQSTEKRILNATMRVIAKKSLSGVRLRAIADEAGVVMSNLHYYYKTKEELLTALLENLLNCFQDMYQDLQQQRPTFRAQFAGFFEQKEDILLHHPEMDWVEIDFFGQMHHNEIIRQYFIRSYDIWREGVESAIGHFYPTCPPVVRTQYARMAVSLMVGASWQYLMDEEAFDLNGYFRQCLEVMVDAISLRYG